MVDVPNNSFEISAKVLIGFVERERSGRIAGGIRRIRGRCKVVQIERAILGRRRRFPSGAPFMGRK
jgi:hypothetical protein